MSDEPAAGPRVPVPHLSPERQKEFDAAAAQLPSAPALQGGSRSASPKPAPDLSRFVDQRGPRADIYLPPREERPVGAWAVQNLAFIWRETGWVWFAIVTSGLVVMDLVSWIRLASSSQAPALVIQLMLAPTYAQAAYGYFQAVATAAEEESRGPVFRGLKLDQWPTGSAIVVLVLVLLSLPMGVALLSLQVDVAQFALYALAVLTLPIPFLYLPAALARLSSTGELVSLIGVSGVLEQLRDPGFRSGMKYLLPFPMLAMGIVTTNMAPGGNMFRETLTFVLASLLFSTWLGGCGLVLGRTARVEADR